MSSKVYRTPLLSRPYQPQRTCLPVPLAAGFVVVPVPTSSEDTGSADDDEERR
jgi:hypothetical protein